MARINKELLEKLKNKLESNKALYTPIYKYFTGETDALQRYKMVTERSNLKVGVNFLKKFVREEVAYSVGNEITYLPLVEDAKKPIERLNYHFSGFDETHDIDLATNLILFGLSYEVYIFSKDEIEGNIFDTQVYSPLIATHFELNGEILFFIELNQGENITYKLYDSENIYYFDSNLKQTSKSEHLFKGKTPVGIAELDDGYYSTIFNDIKGLQDAYETNLSDICNEISDFRNAYMVLTGSSITSGQAKMLKREGLINPKNPNSKVEWLIKNINDTFIQNTLKTLEDKMYQVTGHINNNEAMQSNTSSLALRTRLISLEQKCKLNQKALTNCIKKRLANFLYFLKITENTSCSYRDIKVKFTPNVPQDDLMMANIVNTLGSDRLSTETALAQFSFIQNVGAEMQKLKAEKSETRDGELALLEAEKQLKSLEVNSNGSINSEVPQITA